MLAVKVGLFERYGTHLCHLPVCVAMEMMRHPFIS